MNTRELKQKIEDEFGVDEFRELVNQNLSRAETKKEKARFAEVIGASFEFLNSKRTEGSGDYDGYAWRFKIGEHTYEVGGYYSSYEGEEMDDVMSFYRVEAVKKTITVYEPVDEKE